jgi:prevent-host-death family protein
MSYGTRDPMDELPRPEPISINAARGRLGPLVDEVARGRAAVICRRSTPLAVLLPAVQYEELAEIVRRDQSLAAVLRARGFAMEGWTTAAILEAVVGLIEGTRR